MAGISSHVPRRRATNANRTVIVTVAGESQPSASCWRTDVSMLPAEIRSRKKEDLGRPGPGQLAEPRPRETQLRVYRASGGSSAIAQVVSLSADFLRGFGS